MEPRTASEWGLGDMAVELSLAAARAGSCAECVELARQLRLSLVDNAPQNITLDGQTPNAFVHLQRAGELRQKILTDTGVDPFARRYVPSHVSAELNEYLGLQRSSLSAAAQRELDGWKSAGLSVLALVAAGVLVYVAFFMEG
jgi:hypothetical protein